jgi:hypothetical protein
MTVPGSVRHNSDALTGSDRHCYRHTGNFVLYDDVCCPRLSGDRIRHHLRLGHPGLVGCKLRVYQRDELLNVVRTFRYRSGASVRLC